MQSLILTADTAITADLTTAFDRAEEYVAASTAANTRRAYDNAWRDFTDWSHSHGLDALPASPATVGLYLAEGADRLKVATLKLRLSAIAVRHREAGYALDRSHPAIRKVMRGVARVKGVAPNKKEAATAEILRDAIRAYAAGVSLKAKRDRALLAVGFFAALRRSELVAINVADLSFTADGVILRLPRRKTDAEGAGTDIGLPLKRDGMICPVKALREWIVAAGIVEGPIFRSISKGDKVLTPRLSDRDVARIVKAATTAAGYDASLFSGHSLRSGFVTTAARAGVADHVIMKQTGHKRLEELHGYIRRAGLFTENAAALI